MSPIVHPTNEPSATPAGPWPDSLANAGVFAAAVAAAAPRGRAFPSRDGLDTWVRDTRARFIDLLHYSPPTVDFAPEVVTTQDYGDFTRETLWISVAPWSRIPCEILVPKRPRDGSWPAPAVVGLHCWGGVFRWGREKIIAPIDPDTEHPSLRQYRADLYGGRGYANELARRGYVVAVIDGFYSGERRLRYRHGEWPDPYRADEAALEPDSEAWLAFHERVHLETYPHVAGALIRAGATWPGVFVSEDRRTVDYLQSRPEVDGARIGCIGLSVGGYRSNLLAAADDRIRAAVAVGWLCSTGDLWPMGRWLHSHNWVHYVPGMLQELDLPDLAALSCPRPLMVMQGRFDVLFPLDSVERAIASIGAAYATAGVEDRFQGRLFDGPHEFNVPMQDEAFAWLDRWL